MSTTPWDVVVVGGGPAGSAIAARLAAEGHRVLLLDRERFPRPKPCGDCVSPAAVRELRELGVLAAVLEETHAPLGGWTILPSRDPGFRGSFPPHTRAIAIARERLDRVLLEHAVNRGAEVRTGVRVTGLVHGGGQQVEGVEVAGGQAIRSRLVVGADGLRSVVVRRLELIRRPPRLRKLALTSHVAELRELDGCGELHVLPWGTVGIAPIGGGLANVTLVLAASEAASVAGGRERYYDRMLSRMPRLRGSRRSGDVIATGPFDWPTRRAVADGALLVGDAAGYYDPFTGQGIYRALRGAALAAHAAHEALRVGEVTAARMSTYERDRRKAFLPGSRLQWLIEQFTARPALLRLAAGRFRRRPELADALVAVTGDLRPVRTLLAPRLLAGWLA